VVTAVALLGGDVLGSAQHHPGRGLFSRVAVEELGDAEVEDLDPLAARVLGVLDQEDVLRLNVTVERKP